MAPDNGWGSE
ncbi:hypothetical protein YPPY42_4600, partial [Yersinia pestis PY-42]